MEAIYLVSPTELTSVPECNQATKTCIGDEVEHRVDQQHLWFAALEECAQAVGNGKSGPEDGSGQGPGAEVRGTEAVHHNLKTVGK